MANGFKDKRNAFDDKPKRADAFDRGASFDPAGTIGAAGPGGRPVGADNPNVYRTEASYGGASVDESGAGVGYAPYRGFEAVFPDLGDDVRGGKEPEDDETPKIDEELEDALIIPHRKLIKVVKYLGRSNKAALTAGILTITVGVLFGIAFMQEHMGQFTINLNRVDMWRRALSMSETVNFANPTSRLTVDTIKRTTNIARDDIPWDTVDVGDGNKSGTDYLCYSFYIKNGGIEDVDCDSLLKMEYKSKGAENAVRLAVIKDGVTTVYATPAKDGNPEPDTVPFASEDVVMQETIEDFKVDDVHKYTVVMWIDGDDPECVNDIIGGSVRFSMEFDTGESRNVSFMDFIKDLPLFGGAVDDDGMGDKNDRTELWDEEHGGAGAENEQTEATQ